MVLGWHPTQTCVFDPNFKFDYREIFSTPCCGSQRSWVGLLPKSPPRRELSAYHAVAMFVQGIYITYMLHCRDSPGKTEVNENMHCYNYGLAELAGGFPNGYMGIAPKPLSWSGYYPELSNLAPLGRVFLWSGVLCITAGGPVAGQLCGGGPDQCCQGHMYILSDFRDVHSRIYEHKLDLTCY